LLAGPLQQPTDLAVHPTQVVQQPVAELAHLIGLTHHHHPLGLHLGTDLLGHLPRLLQDLLRLGGDLGPHLLGLLLGLLDDRVGAAPGVLDHLLGGAAGLHQQRRGFPADLLEGGRSLLEGGDLVLELGPGPVGGGVLVHGLLQAPSELGEVGVDLLGVIAARTTRKAGGPSPSSWLMSGPGWFALMAPPLSTTRTTRRWRRGSKIPSSAPTAQIGEPASRVSAAGYCS
jgi:hypothetical protein